MSLDKLERGLLQELTILEATVNLRLSDASRSRRTAAISSCEETRVQLNARTSSGKPLVPRMAVSEESQS